MSISELYLDSEAPYYRLVVSMSLEKCSKIANVGEQRSSWKFSYYFVMSTGGMRTEQHSLFDLYVERLSSKSWDPVYSKI